MTPSAPPTLTEPAGLGGVIAQAGFDYQLWYGVVRVATWLADAGFEGVMFEALEDIEARFFAPQSAHGHVLERIQAKSGFMARAGILKVFDNFVGFDQAYPGATRLFELAAPNIPNDMIYLERDLERVRSAGPFYAPFRAVTDASDAKVLADVIADIGKVRGEIIFARGKISLVGLRDFDVAASSFATALQKSFPELDVSMARLTRAFKALVELATDHRGRLLPRCKILSAVEVAVGTALFPHDLVQIHLESDRPDPVPGLALRLDLTVLSGSGRFSPPDVWASDLIEPARVLSGWLAANGSRHVELSGSYRLTTGFVVGAALASAKSFEIVIATKDGPWRTDDHPEPGKPPPPWTTESASMLVGGVLRLAIGVLRDPAPSLIGLGMEEDTLSRAHLPQAVTSGRELQGLVSTLKLFISAEVARLKPDRIELYFVGPASMAVAIGHRWNAMPPTQLFEFDPGNAKYWPTALI